MSTTKKNTKTNEELQTQLQNLITQGRKEGMIRAADLNALLEKMTLTPEKIEEIYDRFEAMNIQVVAAELEIDLGMTWIWAVMAIWIWLVWRTRIWWILWIWLQSTVWTILSVCT